MSSQYIEFKNGSKITSLDSKEKTVRGKMRYIKMYDDSVVEELASEIQNLLKENNKLKEEIKEFTTETEKLLDEQSDTINEIEKIELVLENCEVITIDGKYIGAFYINNIKTNISRVACNSVQKYSTSDDILIEILKDGDIEHLPFGIEDYKTTVFNRLTKVNDITHVEVYWKDDNKHDDIWVTYNEERSFENIYQQSYLSKADNLYISISKDNDIFDIIDKERVDQESYGK